MAHLRHGAMSDLSPLCEQKRTSLSGFRHRSRASFRRPQCGSFRSRLNTRLTRRLSALMTPRQHRRAAVRRDKDQGFHRHLPFCGLMLGSSPGSFKPEQISAKNGRRNREVRRSKVWRKKTAQAKCLGGILQASSGPAGGPRDSLSAAAGVGQPPARRPLGRRDYLDKSAVVRTPQGTIARTFKNGA
jgi:hypothetical protein